MQQRTAQHDCLFELHIFNACSNAHNFILVGCFIWKIESLFFCNLPELFCLINEPFLFALLSDNCICSLLCKAL